MIFLQLGLGLMALAGVACFVAAGQQWCSAIIRPESESDYSHKRTSDKFDNAIVATWAAGTFLSIVIIVAGIVAACGS